MAKVNKYTATKIKPWYETFTGLKAKNTEFTIVYDSDTKRLDLKDGDKLVYSDQSVDSCKYVAKTRHGIKLEQWSNMR
jgi:hypothetical protein